MAIPYMGNLFVKLFIFEVRDKTMKNTKIVHLKNLIPYSSSHLIHTCMVVSPPSLQQGDTPLYWAARHGHLDVVQYLCEEGAAIDAQDKVKEASSHSD